MCMIVHYCLTFSGMSVRGSVVKTVFDFARGQLNTEQECYRLTVAYLYTPDARYYCATYKIRQPVSRSRTSLRASVEHVGYRSKVLVSYTGHVAYIPAYLQ